MKRILAATDFSSRSVPAVRRAAMLAEKHSFSLKICHVVDDDQPARMLAMETEEATRTLDEITKDLPERSRIDCRASVVSGDAFAGVLQAAEASAAELIVIGSHRRRLLRDVFVGTTAERIIRRGTLPVLMVNRPPTHDYRRVVVAVDLSVTSAEALTAARKLGVLSTGQVVIFHAFDAMLTTLASTSLTDEQIRQHLGDASMHARRDVEAFLGSIDLKDIDYTISVQEGSPVLALKDAVQKTGADLVVIGTRGRTGGILKLVLGSVAEEVMREIDTDILAVPPPEKASGACLPEDRLLDRPDDR